MKLITVRYLRHEVQAYYLTHDAHSLMQDDYYPTNEAHYILDKAHELMNEVNFDCLKVYASFIRPMSGTGG